MEFNARLTKADKIWIVVAVSAVALLDACVPYAAKYGR